MRGTELSGPKKDNSASLSLRPSGVRKTAIRLEHGVFSYEIITAALDNGNTLWRVYEALQGVDAWFAID